jgi:hypothetical protein
MGFNSRGNARPPGKRRQGPYVVGAIVLLIAVLVATGFLSL